MSSKGWLKGRQKVAPSLDVPVPEPNRVHGTTGEKIQQWLDGAEDRGAKAEKAFDALYPDACANCATAREAAARVARYGRNESAAQVVMLHAIYHEGVFRRRENATRGSGVSQMPSRYEWIPGTNHDCDVSGCPSIGGHNPDDESGSVLVDRTIAKVPEDPPRCQECGEVENHHVHAERWQSHARTPHDHHTFYPRPAPRKEEA